MARGQRVRMDHNMVQVYRRRKGLQEIKVLLRMEIIGWRGPYIATIWINVVGFQDC